MFDTPCRCVFVGVAFVAIASAVFATDLATLRQDYVNQLYGMFLHFNLGTFTNEEWAAPNQNPNLFNPVALDTDQWAATAQAAGMRYGVLTTKHHDGFALWNTDQSTYDVANAACSWYSNPSSPYYHCDVVQSYADSFRAQGLGVGLYYSIWDRSNGIDGTLPSAAAIAYVKAEIHHLLTSYGFIEVLWTDGWGWQSQTGYDYVNYQDVYNYIKQISPNTLLLENHYTGTLLYTDIVGYEQRLPASGNTLPSETYPTLRADGRWFYKTYNSDVFKSAWKTGDYVRTANAREATCLLDVTPDRNGLLTNGTVQRLMEIKDNLDHPPAPRTGNLATGKTATQSSTWNGSSYPASYAVDGDLFDFAHTASGDYNPWWKVDLGAVYAIGEIDLVNRDGYGGRLRDITVEILAANGTTVVYTSPVLNPGNVLGGGISDYANGPDPLTLYLDGMGKSGRYVRIRRTPEAGYASDSNKYLLTLSEVGVYQAFVPGDANGDGRVDAADAAILATYWGRSNAHWQMGDFDHEGTVGPADASILAANWGRGAAEATAVPEPQLIVLLAGALVWTLVPRTARSQTRASRVRR
jgi:alpha-L-fucosidase